MTPRRTIAWFAVATILGIAGASLAIARGSALLSARESSDALLTAVPEKRRDDGYVGAGACQSCHASEYASWAASFHRTMTQAVTPQTVQANFAATIQDENGEYRVQRRGDEYWVRMPNAGSLLTEYPADPHTNEEQRDRIDDSASAGHEAGTYTGPARTFAWQRAVMSTGSHHMQLFWVRDDASGMLVAFPWSYLFGERQWVPNESTLLRPDHGDVVYTWNAVCVMCHAVAGQPQLQETPVVTRAADLGIACEACHGPGRTHVNLYRSYLDRHREASVDTPARAIINPSRNSARESTAICGQCHSVWLPADEPEWREHGLTYQPGEDLGRHARLVRHPADADQLWMDDVLTDDPEFLVGRFWSDGMVRVVGREYNGWLESPCSQSEDFGCTSCHSLHGYRDRDDQLNEAGHDGTVCHDCHRAIASDLSAHTHHDPASPGSNCYNCHMSHTSYGLLKAARSHEIDNPSAAVARSTGRPNACNLCHLDRTLSWAAEWLASWYGHPIQPEPGDSVVAEIPRLLIQGDAGQRALAAWHMAWTPALEASGHDWQSPLLEHLSSDPYPAVRLVAARAMRRLASHDVTDGSPADQLANASSESAGDRRGDEPSRTAAASALRLRTPNGDLDHRAIERLMRDRDDSVVNLRE